MTNIIAKVKDFDWDKPMSRRDYAVVCGAAYVASLAIYAGVYAYCKVEEYKNRKAYEKARKNFRVTSPFTSDNQ